MLSDALSSKFSIFCSRSLSHATQLDARALSTASSTKIHIILFDRRNQMEYAIVIRAMMASVLPVFHVFFFCCSFRFSSFVVSVFVCWYCLPMCNSLLCNAKEICCIFIIYYLMAHSFIQIFFACDARFHAKCCAYTRKTGANKYISRWWLCIHMRNINKSTVSICTCRCSSVARFKKTTEFRAKCVPVFVQQQSSMTDWYQPAAARETF